MLSISMCSRQQSIGMRAGGTAGKVAQHEVLVQRPLSGVVPGGTTEIHASHTPKQKICEHGKQDRMHHHFARRMKCANAHVKPYPRNRNPSRPISPAQHENSRDDRDQAHHADPQHFPWKRTDGLNLRQVIDQPNYSSRSQDDRENRHREWTFFHYAKDRCVQ
jgi:hypothetical protein